MNARSIFEFGLKCIIIRLFRQYLQQNMLSLQNKCYWELVVSVYNIRIIWYNYQYDNYQPETTWLRLSNFWPSRLCLTDSVGHITLYKHKYTRSTCNSLIAIFLGQFDFMSYIKNVLIIVICEHGKISEWQTITGWLLFHFQYWHSFFIDN